MNRLSIPFSLTLLLCCIAAGSKVVAYTPDGKFPPRILCEDSSQLVEVLCEDSFIWNGVTYRDDGIYYQTFTNAAGCDSVVSLTLTLKPNKPFLAVDCLELATTEPYTTYQWYKNDTAIAGATDPLYVIDSMEPACYSVVVNAAFCPDTSDYYCIENDDVKVAEQSLQNQVKVYPNPAHDRIFIKGPSIANGELILTDIRGREVMRETLKTTSTHIKINRLMPGIYLAQIKSKGRILYQQKVVKQ